MLNHNIVQSFFTIRDIPYRIPLSLDEESCNCAGKAIQLFAICEEVWVPCRYRVCEFFRSDLWLPEDISTIPHDDLTTHVFLEICIKDERYCVDPTRDNGLQSILPVTERNGVSSTYFAVKPIRFYDLVTSHTIMTADHQEQDITDDLVKHRIFYEALNTRFETVRQSNS